jgi:hypothetical protein
MINHASSSISLPASLSALARKRCLSVSNSLISSSSNPLWSVTCSLAVAAHSEYIPGCLLETRLELAFDLGDQFSGFQ